MKNMTEFVYNNILNIMIIHISDGHQSSRDPELHKMVLRIRSCASFPLRTTPTTLSLRLNSILQLYLHLFVNLSEEKTPLERFITFTCPFLIWWLSTAAVCVFVSLMRCHTSTGGLSRTLSY